MAAKIHAFQQEPIFWVHLGYFKISKIKTDTKTVINVPGPLRKY